MRALLFATLLLSTAAPAFADPGDRQEAMIERVRAMRAERAEQRAERPASARVVEGGQDEVRASQGRMERLESRLPSSQEQPVLSRRDRAEALGRVRQQPRGERMDERWRYGRQDAARVDQADTVATWRQDDRRRDRRVQTPALTVNRHWREGWRRNGRYDWHGYRARHRSHYRFGVYSDPFGYNYRRMDLGWGLHPAYYSSRYSLLDPWSYRLPLAPRGYRWVRYYDDALLVDLRSGRVVDVLRDLFW